MFFVQGINNDTKLQQDFSYFVSAIWAADYTERLDSLLNSNQEVADVFYDLEMASLFLLIKSYASQVHYKPL